MEPGKNVPRRRPHLLERDTGEAIIVMAETGHVLHTLEGTAPFIWRLIDGSDSIDMILDRLQSEYAVDRSRAADDLDIFIQQLAEKNMIE